MKQSTSEAPVNRSIVPAKEQNVCRSLGTTDAQPGTADRGELTGSPDFSALAGDGRESWPFENAWERRIDADLRDNESDWRSDATGAF